ncbi:MAG TPA: peptidylprolyl isomerase [Candidatus Saccharimonadales bacterium]|nr:peptidylprolyl isomerase [Candidatus Saccharimonadales bacterium]
MIKKFKKVKKVRELVPEVVAEKAATLNPLAPPKPEEPPQLGPVQRITNENITEHREEVLKGARKYIYPLQHSKRRIVTVTLSIVIGALVAFMIYCGLALYKFYQYNTFVYRATQVVPFPIAKTGGNYVDYENYLFELRHYIHYYQTQQQKDFSGSGQQQLLQFRKQALNDVINNSYVKILARQNRVSVSNKEVDDRIAEVRAQNRLGSNNKVFADVLRDYWGWSVNDFKRSLKDQILAEKVVAKLDTATNSRAQQALAQVNSGTNFTDVAKKFSDDPSAKDNGGDYGISITKENPNIPPQVTEELFKLKQGQVSGIIDAGPTLEIVKVNKTNGASVTAQHISFKLKDIQSYINAEKAKEPVKTYVHF